MRISKEAIAVASFSDMAWRLVHSVANGENDDRPIEAAVGSICEGLAERLAISRVCVFTKDPNNQSYLTFWGNFGYGGPAMVQANRHELVPLTAPPPRSCIAVSWRTRTPMICTKSHPDFKDTEERPQAKEVLYVPFVVAEIDEPVCVVCVESSREGYLDITSCETFIRLSTREPLLALMRLDPLRSETLRAGR